MKVFEAPHIVPKDEVGLKIFLGGSIEMGKADAWQAEVVQFLRDKPYGDELIICNPRRSDWDSSWDMDPHEGPFREQVLWELQHQSQADLLVYYFCAETASPITLLEFGVYHQALPVVCIEPQYGREGNMILTCDYLGVPYTQSREAFLATLEARILKHLSEN